MLIRELLMRTTRTSEADIKEKREPWELGDTILLISDRRVGVAIHPTELTVEPGVVSGVRTPLCRGWYRGLAHHTAGWDTVFSTLGVMVCPN